MPPDGKQRTRLQMIKVAETGDQQLEPRPRVSFRDRTGSGCRASPTGRHLWQRRYREINDWERYLTDKGSRS